MEVQGIVEIPELLGRPDVLGKFLWEVGRPSGPFRHAMGEVVGRKRIRESEMRKRKRLARMSPGEAQLFTVVQVQVANSSHEEKVVRLVCLQLVEIDANESD
jgi:hypothetical protein